MIITTDAEVVGPWVCEKAGGQWIKGRGTAIGKIGLDGKLVAGVLYEDYNGANVVCHIRGDPSWACKQFLWLIFDYPFNQLKVKRITGLVNSANKEAMNLNIRLGFTLECSLVQATPEGDMNVFRMLREECRYLKGKYNGQK